MDDASEERQRLDALHNKKFVRIRRIQEQQRDHTAQTQAKAREHYKLMLGLKHLAIHGATIAHQKALHELDCQHRKRSLKLERRYASAEMGTKLEESVPEPENAHLRNKAVGEHGRGLKEFATVGSGSEAAVGPEETFTEARNTE